jgi:peptidoglycan/LPS O-acetylase OafA/YrhL
MDDVFKFSMTLMGFVVAFWVASAVGKFGVFQTLANRQGRDTALDGLRGYLALSVFFHHLVVTWNWKSTGIWAGSSDVYFLNYGKVGVFIFFMITGYLFVGKLIRAKSDNFKWCKLYESRVFRIFPLYLFALLVISLIVAEANHFELNVGLLHLLKEYSKWIVFHGSTLNGFAETKTIIAEVDWTLKYEWLFYVSLPLIAAGLKFRYGGVLILLLCLGLFLFPYQVKQFNTAYFLMFGIGGLCAWAKRYQNKLTKFALGLPASLIALVSISAAIFYPNTMDIVHVLMITVFFIAVVLGNDIFGLFSSRASIVLGEISYSIYLLHGILLYVLFTVANPLDLADYTIEEFMVLTPLLTVLVVIVSAISYRWIEKPSLEYGRQYRLTRMLSGGTGGRKYNLQATATRILPGLSR